MNKQKRIEKISDGINFFQNAIGFPLNFIVSPYYEIVSTLIAGSILLGYLNISIFWALVPIALAWTIQWYVGLAIGVTILQAEIDQKKRLDAK